MVNYGLPRKNSESITAVQTSLYFCGSYQLPCKTIQQAYTIHNQTLRYSYYSLHHSKKWASKKFLQILVRYLRFYCRFYTTDLQAEKSAEVPWRTFFHSVEYFVRRMSCCCVFCLTTFRHRPVCSRCRRVRSAWLAVRITVDHFHIDAIQRNIKRRHGHPDHASQRLFRQGYHPVANIYRFHTWCRPYIKA